MNIFSFVNLFHANTSENVFLILLQSGVERDVLTEFARTAIQNALDFKYFKVVEYLLRNGLYVDNQIISQLAKSGNENLLELALCSKNTFAVNKMLSFPVFPHDWEKLPNATSICRALLKHGFDPNYLEKELDAPLIGAIRSRKEEIIELLLDYGADPLKRYFYYPPHSPLEEAFQSTISVRSVENMIKYAAVHDEFQRKIRSTEFCAYFRDKSCWIFASLCKEEIKILKDLNVDNNRLCLLNFILLKGKSLEEFLKDPENTRGILKVLASTAIPIYFPLIMKKLDRKSVLNSFSDLSSIKWCPITNGIPLYYLCVAHICDFLCKEDLINLWIAIH